MKRTYIILIVSITALIAVSILIYFLFFYTLNGKIDDDDHNTDDIYEYDYRVKPDDMYFVGVWRESMDTQWYKAFYDDYAGEGYFWGKEWKEDDDVSEEDISYHGNGWFKWQRKDNHLIEMHVMTMSSAFITKKWIINIKPHANNTKGNQTLDSLILIEQDYKNIRYRFSRVVD